MNCTFNMNSLRKGCLTLSPRGGIISRLVQSNASLLENCSEVQNRNPRNLELMTIARKPEGYHLEEKKHQFWNKLYLEESSKHIDAGIMHHKNGPIITVSTRESAVRNQVYRNLNVATFAILGKLLAHRCLESGISEIFCDIDPQGSQRKTAFVEELQKNGIILQEPIQYTHAKPWDLNRMLKPWTVQD